MAGVREGLHRSRRGAALAMMTLAAVLLVLPMIEQLMDPGWPEADEFQAHLEAWSRVLAPVERLVPAGEALTYACPVDEQGKPDVELERWFPFFQAVLAPRRIGRAVESRYVLAHFETRDGQAPPSFAPARVLAELAQGLVLVETTGP